MMKDPTGGCFFCLLVFSFLFFSSVKIWIQKCRQCFIVASLLQLRDACRELGRCRRIRQAQSRSCCPSPFPRSSPRHRRSSGLRSIMPYLMGWSGSNQGRLVLLLLEDYSKTQENHHNPTLTWWSSAIKLRYHFRGPVEMGGNEAISRVSLSPLHPLLPQRETGKRLFARLPWVQQLKPCIKMYFWVVLSGPAVSRTQRTENAFFS